MRKMSKAFFFLLMSLYCTSTFAFSVADISNFSSADAHTTRLAEVIQELVEPMYKDSSRNGTKSYACDSAGVVLQSILSKVENQCTEDCGRHTMLLRGLAWHYLNRLGTAEGFRKADSLATYVMTRYPAYPDGAWFKGVNLILSARISEGFRILDSLRADAEFTGQRFLAEYASLSAACFLPRTIRMADTVVHLNSVRFDMFPAHLGESEAVPSQTGWSVHSPVAALPTMPIFIFTAEFSLSRQFNLVLPSFRARSEYVFTMNIRPDIVQAIPTPSVNDPFKKKYSSRITITVKPTECTESLPDYVYGLIMDKYDAVMQKHELEKLGAISLRCYKRSAFYNVSGYEYAIVAFDRMVREDSLYITARCKETTTRKKKHMKIRYVIAMESRSAVKDKSELLLQDVLRNFEVF